MVTGAEVAPESLVGKAVWRVDGTLADACLARVVGGMPIGESELPALVMDFGWHATGPLLPASRRLTRHKATH
ncbi:hypothetical protein GCM10027597_05140 [Saccharopolyspora tripterygii]